MDVTKLQLMLAAGALLVLSGHAAAKDAGELLGLDAEEAAYTALQLMNDDDHRHHCSARCNDDKAPLDSEEPFTCWGVFRVVCHRDGAFAVAKCTGRHQGFPGHLGAACEGELVHFAVAEFKPHKHHHHDDDHDDDDDDDGDENDVTLQAVSLAGCRGTASVLIGPSPHHSPHSLTDNSAMLASLWSLTDAELEPIPSWKEDVASGRLAWRNASEIEGRCEGKSLDLKAVKQRPRGAPAMTAEAAEGIAYFVSEEQAPGVLSPPSPLPESAFLLGGPPPPPPAFPFPFGGEGDGDDDPHHHPHGGSPPPPVCGVTCNGQPMWWGGALPCWGETRLVCEPPPHPPHHHDGEDEGRGDDDDDEDEDEGEDEDENDAMMHGMMHKMMGHHGSMGMMHGGNAGGGDGSHHRRKLLSLHHHEKDGSEHKGHHKDSDFEGHHGHEHGHDRDHDHHKLEKKMKKHHDGDEDEDDDHSHHHHHGCPHHHHGPDFRLDARCRGFFTGRWFGSACYGTSLSMADFAEGQKISVCTEWQKVSARPPRGPHGGGMMVLCEGKRLVAFKRRPRDDGGGSGGGDAPAAAPSEQQQPAVHEA